MRFIVEDRHGRREMDVTPRNVVMVGFSGRDIEKAMEHVGELERNGVQCPSIIPSLYSCDPSLAVQTDAIIVHGKRTSGEAEYLILKHDGRYYIGLGSDHTDRDIEMEDIPASKQACPKPCAGVLWDYYEIKDHIADLRLVSTTTVRGAEMEYQDGVAGDILPPIALLNKVSKAVDLEDCLIFSGTVPLLRGYKYGERFSCRLVDDELGREINLSYEVHVAE